MDSKEIAKRIDDFLKTKKSYSKEKIEYERKRLRKVWDNSSLPDEEKYNLLSLIEGDRKLSDYIPRMPKNTEYTLFKRYEPNKKDDEESSK